MTKRLKGFLKMGIYLQNGYLNIKQILSYGLPFNFVVGGRGTGKTYGTLKTAYEEHMRFILMRRTQAQCDLINKPEFNPFKALNNDTGSNARLCLGLFCISGLCGRE